MLYPIKFTSIHKKMVWGSESWDISCRPDEMGVIESGPMAGFAFDKAISTDPIAFLGRRIAPIYEQKGFPLLVKIISAKDDLSVQVHPDDDYAAANGFESGKNEMWYVMEAPDAGYLIIGLTQDAAPEKLRENPMSCLHYLPVKRGDIINIPAGLVHALTSGVMVAEIQQNSDVTFRLFDYNRIGLDGKPRELHVDDAVNVTDFSARGQLVSEVKNRHFTVEKYEVEGGIQENSDPEAFCIYTCVEGQFELYANTIRTEMCRGSSVFIPAALGSYTITGRGIFLKSKPGVS